MQTEKTNFPPLSLMCAASQVDDTTDILFGDWLSVGAAVCGESEPVLSCGHANPTTN